MTRHSIVKNSPVAEGRLRIITATVIVVIATLIRPLIEGDDQQLRSRMMMFLIIAGMMVIQLFIQGFWILEFFLMFAILGEPLAEIAGSKVQNLLWICEFGVFFFLWMPTIQRSALRRRDAKLGTPYQGLPAWKIQSFLIPSYLSALSLVIIFGVILPWNYAIPRHEIVENILMGIIVGSILGLLRNENVFELVLFFGAPGALAIYVGVWAPERRGYSIYSLITMIFLGSYIISCLRKSPAVLEHPYKEGTQPEREEATQTCTSSPESATWEDGNADWRNAKPRVFSFDMKDPPTRGVFGLGPRIKKSIRVMSRNPAQPRVFWQVALAPVEFVLTVVMAGTFVLAVTDGTTEPVEYFLLGGVLLLMIWLLHHALRRQFGVDRDKVWNTYGRLLHRQVRFAEVTRIDTNMGFYTLWANGTKISIERMCFDYALVYLRLLEELHRRRIRLPEADITDPDWEQAAQYWRNTLAENIWVDHHRFYATHPEQLARLNALVQPPGQHVQRVLPSQR
ncbi:hypothetical protein [Cutibacterium granulosum]|uniref:hypothetical protein n=1 Tax=Cutibacterium granulosum TaxID=33011 RepID=UPI0023F888FC|nr:hypothetical protein [Cutibacterium granulosum]